MGKATGGWSPELGAHNPERLWHFRTSRDSRCLSSDGRCLFGVQIAGSAWNKVRGIAPEHPVIWSDL